MNNNGFTMATVFLVLALTGVTAGPVSAASVSLVPSASSVHVGQQLTIDVNYDFTGLSSPLGGFGIDIASPAGTLEFIGFTPASGLPATGILTPDLTKTPPELRYSDFGAIFGSGGLTGTGSLGSFTVKALAPAAPLQIKAVIDPVGGDFQLFNASKITPTFHPAQIHVLASTSVTPVPLPAAVVLFLSGLGLFFFMDGIRRRRQGAGIDRMVAA